MADLFGQLIGSFGKAFIFGDGHEGSELSQGDIH